MLYDRGKMPNNAGYTSIVTILAYSVIVPTKSNSILHFPDLSITLFHTTPPSHYPPVLQILTTNNRSAHISKLRQYGLLVSQLPSSTIEKNNRNPSLFFKYHILSPAIKEEERKYRASNNSTYINQLLSRRTRYIPIPNPITQNGHIIAQLRARTRSTRDTNVCL